MEKWNSKQYLKFAKERTQPAIDLANRIELKNPINIFDMGCGPGNSTKVLVDKFPNAFVTGGDNSQNMIDEAKIKYADLNFIHFDARSDFDRIDKKFDVVFSNACIQWVPNHHVLIRNMMNILNNGGVLAVQTPMNYKEPIHIIISEITKSKKWKDKFSNPRVFYNLTQGEYFDLLSDASSDFTIWETVYCHRMKSHDDIMEWYRGTGLRPYLSALAADDAAEFEREVFEEVVKAYPIQLNGEIIFRFPRFFFTAVK